MTSGRLDGKVAIVTGGARGIGAANVRRFVAEGARVMATDLLTGQGAALAAELSNQAIFHEHDVASRAAWQDIVAIAEARWGPVSILINNAGISGAGAPLADETEEGYRHLVDVNQTGVFHGVRAVLPSMQRAGAVRSSMSRRSPVWSHGPVWAAMPQPNSPLSG